MIRNYEIRAYQIAFKIRLHVYSCSTIVSVIKYTHAPAHKLSVAWPALHLIQCPTYCAWAAHRMGRLAVAAARTYSLCCERRHSKLNATERELRGGMHKQIAYCVVVAEQRLQQHNITTMYLPIKKKLRQSTTHLPVSLVWIWIEYLSE